MNIEDISNKILQSTAFYATLRTIFLCQQSTHSMASHFAIVKCWLVFFLVHVDLSFGLSIILEMFNKTKCTTHKWANYMDIANDVFT